MPSRPQTTYVDADVSSRTENKVVTNYLDKLRCILTFAVCLEEDHGPEVCKCLGIGKSRARIIFT